MRYQSYYLVASVLLIIVVFQGCAHNIKMKQIPELKTGSPLSEIKPLTFEIKDFGDERAVKDIIGMQGGHKIKIDKKVTEIIAETISNELSRNGHKVLKFNDADMADVTIEGDVSRYWIDDRDYFFTFKIIGTVEVKMAVTATRSSYKPLLKTYKGTYYFDTSLILPTSLFRDIINQALLKMVEEFTTDPEFLDMLRGIKKS